MAVVAVVTGIVVLFIDMPIPLMGILSVISLVALILFIIGARAVFGPSALMDSASFPVLTPNKNLTAKPDNKQSVHEFFEPYLRMTRVVGEPD